MHDLPSFQAVWRRSRASKGINVLLCMGRHHLHIFTMLCLRSPLRLVDRAAFKFLVCEFESVGDTVQMSLTTSNYPRTY
jgi:hypothetical protein